MCVELPQRINDGEEPVTGQGRQREHRNANRDVLDELGRGAEETAPGPRVQRVDDRRERNRRHD